MEEENSSGYVVKEERWACPVREEVKNGSPAAFREGVEQSRITSSTERKGKLVSEEKSRAGCVCLHTPVVFPRCGRRTSGAPA